MEATIQFIIQLSAISNGLIVQFGSVDSTEVSSITLPQSYTNVNYKVIVKNTLYTTNRSYFIESIAISKTINGWSCYKLNLTSNNSQQSFYVWVNVDYLTIGYQVIYMPSFLVEGGLHEYHNS